ncbi:MAG: hypothetical protein V1903_12735 [Bacteroidota bacterium]
MKIRAIFFLLLLSGLSNGQITFNPEIGGRSERAKIAIRPYYHNLMHENYRDLVVRTPPEWAGKFKYEWAVEHKTLPLELWLHIDPDFIASTNLRVGILAQNLTADLITEIEPFSEQLMARAGCSSGHWAKVSGIDPAFSNKSGGIIMSFYKGDYGLVEYFLVFDDSQFERVKEEVYLMMLAFCFRPEPKADESAGVGVKISYDTRHNMFLFQEVGKGAGAHDAGYLPGDLIMSIDGKDEIYLEDMYSVTSMLKGPEGTEVEVEVLRDGLLYESKITRGKYIPEQVTFLTAGSREVALERIRRFSEFFLYADDVLEQKGSEAGKDPLGNQQWEYMIKFPGEFPGVLTHNTYLFDRYEISYKLTSDANSEKSEEIYNTYKSVFSEAMGDEYDTEESTDDNGMVRFRVTDPDDILDGNSIVLILDKSSYEKSVIIEYIFPQ